MVSVGDTSVFVSACLGKGAANAVVASCLRDEHTPLMSAALFAEYEDVLARAPLFRGCRLSADERSELLDVFLGRCRWTRIYFAWRPNVPDEGDNHVVELAVAGGASRIVTGNVRHLAHTGLQFPGLAAITPAQFLKEART